MSPLLGTLTGPVLLIVGFVLALLAGVWVARRLQFCRQSQKLAKRAELWSCLLLLSGVFLPQLALRLADLNDRNWAATRWDWGWLAVLVTFSLFNVVRLPALWRAARAERLAANAAGESLAPSLRGQLLLILLPVVGLAVVGMISLARDRAAVEAAARREAEDVARELAGRLSVAWPSRLGEVELAGNVWIGDGVVGGTTVHWPGEVAAGTDPNGVSDTLLARGARHFCGPPEATLPVQLRLDAHGLVSPPPYRRVPQPPTWLGNLTNETAEVWQQLRAAELESPPQLDSLVKSVSRATRETGPNLLAEFLALRHATENATNAVSALLKLGQRAVDNRCETELGLPLGVVALAEAERRAPGAVLDRDWFQLIRGLTLTQPSLLTSWVLNVGDRLAGRTRTAENNRRMTELWARWVATERLRELSRDLAGTGQSNVGSLENRWFTNASGAWFAAMKPTEAVLDTFEAGRRFRITNQETLVRLFSVDTLERAAFNSLHTVAWVNGRERSTPPRLPTGLALSLELEGKLLSVPAPRPVQDTPAPVLAEGAGEFRLEGEWAVDGQDKPQRFDDWPSRPKFTVRVHLADSAALFAAQRRQQWLFVGMILVTASVAGLGAWQMNRAFRRQLALNAEKSNFVASVSHELRTPLASLRLLAEGLATGRVEEETKRREYAGFLVQETRRLGALVENVLDFARIEQGRKQYQFEPTDLARLVTATVRLFEPLAAERQVRLELNLPAGSAESVGSLEVNADGAALQQALVNLLDNALKHAPADSVVTIALEGSVHAPLGCVRLSVGDAGPGIPPEDHERIFERFFRRGSELRRETQGVGLGLAIVKHIVAAHRGRVWVESQPGQGARFVVELPVDGGGTE